MALKSQAPILPDECQTALDAIERDALHLPLDALKHVSMCQMCSEARVMWLAQEDFDHCLAQSGYFEKLPGRILQKLPAGRAKHWMRPPLLISAASLLLLAGFSGYWFGRQSHQHTVILEAMIPPKGIQDHFLNDPTSFSSIEIFSQVPNLTDEETLDLMTNLKKPEANLQLARSVDD